MEHKNDLSLLRPFNRDAADAGEPICYKDGERRDFIEYEPYSTKVCARNRLYREYLSPQAYRMAPLTWKEGKPVYKGDVMFHTSATADVPAKVTITGFSEQEGFFDTEEFGPRSISIKWVTWEPPKIEQISRPTIYDLEGAKRPDPPKPEHPSNEAVDSRAIVDKFFAMVKQLRTHAVHLECPRKDWIEEFDALLAQAEAMSKMPSVTLTIDTQDAVAALSSAKEAVTSDLLAATRSELDRANATLAEMVGCCSSVVNIMGDMLKKVDKQADVALHVGQSVIATPHIDFSAVGKNVITKQPFISKPEHGGTL